MPLYHAYTTLVPLSTTSGDIMSGSPIKFAPRGGTYRFFGRHSAVGAEVLRLNVVLGGGQQITPPGGVPITKLAGAPNMAEDEICTFSVTAGTEVIATLSESGAVNATPNIKIVFG